MSENVGFLEAGLLLNLSKLTNAIEVLNALDTEEFLLADEYKFTKIYANKYGLLPGNMILLQQFDRLRLYEVDNNAQYYLDNLLLLDKARKLKRLAVKMVGEAEDGNWEDGAMLALQQIPKLLNGHKPVNTDFLSIHDSDGIKEQYNKRVLSFKLGVSGWPSGFIQIDKGGNGLMPGDLLGIMGRPGVSKTFTLLHSVFVAWRKGAKVVFISPEMTKEEIIFRLLPMVAFEEGLRLSNNELRLGKVSDMDTFDRVLELTKQYPIFVVKSGNERTGVSTDYVRQLLDEYHPDILAIDGVRLFRGFRGERWDILDEIFYGLLDLAVTYNVVISVAHQANRGAENTAVAPKLSDAAGGDAMAKACTYVITLAMDTERHDIRYTTLQKNRYGEESIFRTPVTYNPDIGDVGGFVNMEGLEYIK